MSTDKTITRGAQSIYSFFEKDKSEIHPAELASFINELSDEHIATSFLEIDQEDQPDTFTYLDGSTQNFLVYELPTSNLSYILNELESDDCLDVFNRLDIVDRGKYLTLLDDIKKKTIQDLLGYPKNSVARLINTDFASITKNMTVAQAFSHLRKFHDDSDVINTIYIQDVDGKLLDDMPLRRLVLNEPDTKIADIMDNNYVALNINDTRSDAIVKFKEYDRVTMPVINNDNVVMGIITVDDILDVAEQKETADAQKFGGVEELDFPYVKTPFFQLIEKRAGWLIILFLGEMFTATAMGFFEHEISQAVVLALFIPLVISSGGNSGSQAATLIIRAMALKELSIKDWWYVMKREFFSGLFLGLTLGTIGFFRIMIWQGLEWYDYGEHWLLIAVTIFLSLIGIVLWGTLTGSMIPIILKRFKLDPATSSAPFVATMVDVTGLVIYFSIAALVLSGTLL